MVDIATDLSHQMKRYMNSTDNTDSRYDTDITGEQLADNKIIYHPWHDNEETRGEVIDVKVFQHISGQPHLYACNQNI